MYPAVTRGLMYEDLAQHKSSIRVGELLRGRLRDIARKFIAPHGVRQATVSLAIYDIGTRTLERTFSDF